ncbi:LysM peptidoglycan-binding domain-containing protein [Exiguobacterium sp. SH3S2]|uniref:LysM peptidoglycan-binding and 3D domain-containing protein n=1 Tax=unclassified Exiguobacterium TaxID=2644629 RepID=UPI00103B65D9|nr:MULTISPECIES: 3D domain-containing protein [unclassified Exiguobacterium]TCI43453.1 LysM peptidoglycan-binding domain-containing protein [Exiguobacterium sp. SH5S32]TCI45751.1 LysM peptidoglycan-binding domain-containing protein [Exiguobacterium sp. SH3S3]TCI52401.1 LysM peptidoglycan-binding domain-containing protein [Exiguobacterium sp. SH1S4]TCI60960.1 LysM peptidoglycan-binding domain-containing protein [Exiguobacterium sp. SH3S2]TCI68708.1 LysM peptidoglycan-binding domain-containing p
MKKPLLTLTALAGLSLGVAAPASAASTHTVQSGDTLYRIAVNNGVSVNDIKQANSLNSNMIYPNQVLKLAKSEAKATASSNTYTVKSGDTLYRIATNNGVSVNQLMTWNGLKSDLIFPGQQFAVKGAKAASVANSAPTAKPKASTSAPVTKQSTSTTQTQAPASGKTMTVEATAYTPYCAGCSGITATGIDVRSNPNQKVIAVDPSVIPLGSKVWVEGYGEAIAGDTGGAIKGNKIDLLMPTQQQALNFGRKSITIKVLN